MALALSGLAFARVAPELPGMNGVGSLDRVEAPTIAEAPETVSEDVSREAREQAEREAQEAREKVEKEKAEAEKRAAEERAAEQRDAEQRDAEERAATEEQASADEEGASEEQYAGEGQYADEGQGTGEEQYAEGSQDAADEQYAADEDDKEFASGEAPATSELYLTVPKMGISGDPVANASDEATLRNGAGKIPATGFPWQPGSNTYIASHVYGYEGTGSWQHFAALPSMTYGDIIILSDANGNEYRYAVSEILTVAPTDVWVTNPEPGRDMVSLQTCVGPGWSERLVVRADRVA